MEAHGESIVTSDPLGGRKIAQFCPESLDVVRGFANQQWSVGFRNARCDQPVSWQVSMGSGVTIPLETGVGMDHGPYQAPMGDLMRAVRNARARNWHVQDKCLNLGNFH